MPLFVAQSTEMSHNKMICTSSHTVSIHTRMAQTSHTELS